MQASREAPKWGFPDEEVVLSAILVDGLKWEAMAAGDGGSGVGGCKVSVGVKEYEVSCTDISFHALFGPFHDSDKSNSRTMSP